MIEFILTNFLYIGARDYQQRIYKYEQEGMTAEEAEAQALKDMKGTPKAYNVGRGAEVQQARSEGRQVTQKSPGVYEIESRVRDKTDTPSTYTYVDPVIASKSSKDYTTQSYQNLAVKTREEEIRKANETRDLIRQRLESGVSARQQTQVSAKGGVVLTAEYTSGKGGTASFDPNFYPEYVRQRNKQVQREQVAKKIAKQIAEQPRGKYYPSQQYENVYEKTKRLYPESQGFAERIQTQTQRIEAFQSSPRMKRLQVAGAIVTDPKLYKGINFINPLSSYKSFSNYFKAGVYTPYESKGFVGKTAQITVTGAMSLPTLPESLTLIGGNIAASVEADFRGYREQVIKEGKRSAGETLKLYNPLTPEGASTYLTALTFGSMAGYARVKSGALRFPNKYERTINPQFEKVETVTAQLHKLKYSTSEGSGETISPVPSVYLTSEPVLKGTIIKGRGAGIREVGYQTVEGKGSVQVYKKGTYGGEFLLDTTINKGVAKTTILRLKEGSLKGIFKALDKGDSARVAKIVGKAKPSYVGKTKGVITQEVKPTEFLKFKETEATVIETEPVKVKGDYVGKATKTDVMKAIKKGKGVQVTKGKYDIKVSRVSKVTKELVTKELTPEINRVSDLEIGASYPLRKTNLKPGKYMPEQLAKSLEGEQILRGIDKLKKSGITSYDSITLGQVDLSTRQVSLNPKIKGVEKVKVLKHELIHLLNPELPEARVISLEKYTPDIFYGEALQNKPAPRLSFERNIKMIKFDSLQVKQKIKALEVNPTKKIIHVDYPPEYLGSEVIQTGSELSEKYNPTFFSAQSVNIFEPIKLTYTKTTPLKTASKKLGPLKYKVTEGIKEFSRVNSKLFKNKMGSLKTELLQEEPKQIEVFASKEFKTPPFEFSLDLPTVKTKGVITPVQTSGVKEKDLSQVNQVSLKELNNIRDYTPQVIKTPQEKLNVKPSFNINLSVKNQLKNLNIPDIKQKSEIRSESRNDQIPKVEQLPKVIQIPKIEQIQKSEQIQKIDQVQKLQIQEAQKITTPNIRTGIKTFTSTPSPLIPFKIPFSKNNIPKTSKGFIVLLKRGGKFQQLPGVYTKESALDVGASQAIKTLAATFKIKSVSQAPSLSKISSGAFRTLRSKFRSYKISKGKKIPLTNTFIQKRETRLGSSTEVKEIKLAKIKKKRF